MNKTVEIIPVLIAEDDIASFLLIQEFFTELSVFFQLTHAADGAVALDIFDKNSYQLVVLNIRLPEVNGIDVLKSIKNQAPNQIVFAYTAYCISSKVSNLYRLGFDEVLIKPLEFDVFSKIVMKYFKA